MTITILDRLEKPVLLVAIFHIAVFAKSLEGVACAFEGLYNAALKDQLARQYGFMGVGRACSFST